MNTDEMLTAALEYAARGWPVFPLDGKDPITPHGVKDATTDEGQIKSWWTARPSANIGLATGGSSAVVVDFDGPVAEAVIAEYVRVHGIDTVEADLSTASVRTAKGEHLYFGWVEECKALKNWTRPVDDLDIRTTGGYVVVPPSIHPGTGAAYEWIVSPEDGNLRPFPGWMIDLLLESKNKKRAEKLEGVVSTARMQKAARLRDDGDGHPYGQAALEGEIAELRSAPEGERNDRLNKAAFALFGLCKAGVLDRGEVEREMSRVARSIGLEYSEISKTLASAWSGAVAREIPDEAWWAGSTDEDDGIKSITEEELNGLPVAENPRLFVSLEPDNFISEYVDYASSLSDAYVEYHFAAALFMVSTAIDRRAVLKLKQGTVHPNLWLFCLGNSTTSRKTTSMNEPEAILDTYEVGRRLPSSFSPEALIEALADCPRSYFMKDEAGGLLASMSKKYMEETRDFFSELYEGKDYHRKLRTGQRKEKREFQIRSPYVTQWLATTPDNFRAYTSELDVTSGWLLRYAYFWPDYVKPWRAFEEATNEDFSQFVSISMKYRDLKEKLAGLDIEGLKLSLTAEGWEHFAGWQRAIEERAMMEEDRIAQAVAGRLMTFALKLAMVFTIGRWDFDPSTTRAISLEHVQEATRQVESYFLPMARVVIEEVARSEKENLQNRIIGTIRRAGGKITRRDLLRRLHVRLEDVDKAISALEASEEIEKLQVEDGKGPTKHVYRLTVSNVTSVSNVTQIPRDSTRSDFTDRDKSSCFIETVGTVATDETVVTGETLGPEELPAGGAEPPGSEPSKTKDDNRIFEKTEAFWRDLSRQYDGLNSRVLIDYLGYDDLKAGIALNALLGRGWLEDDAGRLHPPASFC